MKTDCQIPKHREKQGCLAMPKNEIDLKFSQIIDKLKSILEDGKEIKSILLQHALDVVSIKKDIERIDKERNEDKVRHQKDIEIVHQSIRRRDKKQMWITTLIVSIGGILATVANMFITNKI